MSVLGVEVGQEEVIRFIGGCQDKEAVSLEELVGLVPWQPKTHGIISDLDEMVHGHPAATKCPPTQVPLIA